VLNLSAMRRSFKRAVIAALALATFGCAGEPVKLRFPTSPDGPPLNGRLFKPEGDGPFPGIVLLPTCSGPRNHVYTWAGQLRDAGYVVQLVDSVTPRNALDNCHSLAVSVDDVARDALHALTHLRALPFVDGSRIAVVGFSYGGMAALRLTSGGYAKRVSPLPGFRAAVAFYPHCTPKESRLSFVQRNLYDDVAIPLLMLLGGQDAEADSTLCVRKADTLRRGGKPVSYRVYADATHGFDQGGRGWRGDAYLYNIQAVDESRREMQAFLKEHLK
jgi:dienelactone hydrolase